MSPAGWRGAVLYPFGFAVFPALSLAASNRGENIHVPDLALPVAICLWAAIVAWFAILFTGTYPRGMFDFVVGVGRWSTRVWAYAFLLVTDVYPPFSLR